MSEKATYDAAEADALVQLFKNRGRQQKAEKRRAYRVKLAKQRVAKQRAGRKQERSNRKKGRR